MLDQQICQAQVQFIRKMDLEVVPKNLVTAVDEAIAAFDEIAYETVLPVRLVKAMEALNSEREAIAQSQEVAS
jgi:hypothetical protein